MNVATPAMAAIGMQSPHPLWAGFVLQLSQLIGISVAFPLVFAPLSALYFPRNEKFKRDTAAFDAIVLCSVGGFAVAGMFAWPEADLAVDIFNFFPLPLCALLWLLRKMFSTTTVVGSGVFEITEDVAYLFAAGVAHALWVMCVVLYISEGLVDWEECHVAFLLVDTVALMTGLFIYLKLQDASPSVFTVLLWSVILSPGSAIALALRKARKTKAA
jgi:hypothetical protein